MKCHYLIEEFQNLGSLVLRVVTFLLKMWKREREHKLKLLSKIVCEDETNKIVAEVIENYNKDAICKSKFEYKRDRKTRETKTLI